MTKLGQGATPADLIDDRAPPAGGRPITVPCLAAGSALAALGMLAWVVVHGVMNNPVTVALFAQSDTLLAANWMHALSRFPGDWRWFKLPQVTSLVPDLALYALVQALVGSWRSAMIVYAALMALVLGVLGGVGAARIGGRSRALGIAAASGCTALILAGTTLFGRHAMLDFSPDAIAYPESIYLFVLLPVTHGGPFILSILAVLLAYDQMAARCPNRKTWLFIAIVAAGVASDGLFLVNFVIPVAIAAYACRTFTDPERDVQSFFKKLGLGCVIGFIIPMALYRGELPGLSVKSFLLRAQHLVSDIPALPPTWLAWAIFGVAAVALGRGLRGRRRLSSRDFADHRALFIAVFGMAAALVSLAGCAIMYLDAGIYRYAMAWLWWPLFVAIGFALRRVPVACGEPGLFACAASLLPSLAALALVAAVPPLHADAMSGWHSRAARCVGAARARRHLHAGLADFLLGRSVSASADFAWQIDQISETGVARPWGNDTRSFFRDFDHPGQSPRYDYILVGPGDDRPALQRVFGRPDAVDACPLADVWSWRDDRHLRPLLLAHADRLRWELHQQGLTMPRN